MYWALYIVQNAEGNGLAPFDCWLLLRGIKTMSIRMEKAISNTEKIVEFLERHPLVTRINYPALAQHPNHAVHDAQASKGGSIISFDTGRSEFPVFSINFSITSHDKQSSASMCPQSSYLHVATSSDNAPTSIKIRLQS